MAKYRRAVVCAVGSGGDVLPFVQVARALAETGLETTLLGPARYSEYAAGTGARYESIGAEDVFAEVFDQDDVWHPRKGLAASWRYYGAAMRSGLQRIRRGWSAADTLLASSSFAVAARLAEELDGFDNTTIHVSPAILFSAACPPRWPGGSIPHSWPLAWRRLALAAAERVFLDPVIKTQVNPFRADLGLPPVSRIFSHWINSPRKVIYAFPEWFARPAPDWPAQGMPVGFLMKPRHPQALPADIEDFLAAARQPVAVITPGTAVLKRQAWVGTAIAAAQARGHRVIVVQPGEKKRVSSAGVLETAYAPFEHLLPRVQLLIHHGGIGTIAEGLRAGIPQIAMPTAHDQFDNAARLEELGCGAAVAAGTSLAAFDAAIARVSNSEAVRARIEKARQLMVTQEGSAHRIALALSARAPAPAPDAHRQRT